MIRYEERAQEIGARIKKERIALGLKPKKFLPKIYMSESSTKTLANWENGEKIPDLTTLAAMAELFGCDIGYLLCDYDEKSHTTVDIKKQLGLSGEAILALQNMNPKQIAITVLSSILVQPEIDQWLFQIYRIAGERSVCENLKDAAIAERITMENRRLTTQAESVLEHIAITEFESAELQEFKRHNKMLEGVVSDLCSADSNIKEYGMNGAEMSIRAYREKFRLGEKENG